MKVEISLTLTGEVIAAFFFEEAEAYYAWETIRNFSKTLKRSPYCIRVSYQGE